MSVLVTPSPLVTAFARSQDARRAKRGPARRARGRESSRGFRVWRANGAGSWSCSPDGNRAWSRSADGVGYGDRAATRPCNAGTYDVVSGSSSPLPGRRCSLPLDGTTVSEEDVRRKRSEGEEDRLEKRSRRRCHRVNQHLGPGQAHALSERRWQFVNFAPSFIWKSQAIHPRVCPLRVDCGHSRDAGRPTPPDRQQPVESRCGAVV